MKNAFLMLLYYYKACTCETLPVKIFLLVLLLSVLCYFAECLPFAAGRPCCRIFFSIPSVLSCVRPTAPIIHPG